MPTHYEIRKMFFDRVNKKLQPELLLPVYPSKLLDNAIDECLEGYNINNKTLFEYLGPEKTIDFLYFKWKWRFKMYLDVDTSRISMTIEGVNAETIQNKRGQFEEIFKRIDQLDIFHEVELY
ncbi:MAG: hypothetical protein IM598_10625 [Chitinophagaceae bacterium]|nr:hypothetical protein [Chitinophagaceae bacterium]MCA6460384.1 hypothetical protein [Chitinophagaceae bacterium]MCA6465271.1 hypothetical protein [Chitinophagaceae bacterium]